MIKTPTKQEMILEEMLSGPINRFQAERIGDHVLNSTAATLANHHNIIISRRWIKLPGRFGSIRCREYWIDPDHRDKAYKLLQSLQKKRGYDLSKS
jgi:hypothetical protein